MPLQSYHRRRLHARFDVLGHLPAARAVTSIRPTHVNNPTERMNPAIRHPFKGRMDVRATSFFPFDHLARSPAARTIAARRWRTSAAHFNGSILMNLRKPMPAVVAL